MFYASKRILASINRDRVELGFTKYWLYVGYDAAVHTYHGFKLLGINTRRAVKIVRRLNRGESITRKERLMMESVTTDLLRLIPFSFFIIIPGAEILLPVALKMFPDMIPSTFESSSQGKIKAINKQIKLQRSKQQLLEYTTRSLVMSSIGKDWEKIKEPLELLRRQGSQEAITTEHIRSIEFLFRPTGSCHLSKLPPDVIVSLAKVAEIYPRPYEILPNSLVTNLLRKRINKKMEKLKKDDQLLLKEGITRLNHRELIKAVQMRGMRWIDSTDSLKLQLNQWLELSSDSSVPYHILFFFRPAISNLGDAMKQCPPDLKDKILGTNYLQPHIKEQMDRMFDNISTHTPIEINKEISSTEVKRKAKQRELEEQNQENSYDSSIGVSIHSQLALVEFLKNSNNIDKLFKDIGSISKYKRKRTVNVSECVEYLAHKTNISSHELSLVFDTLEIDTSETITESTLSGILSRCQNK